MSFDSRVARAGRALAAAAASGGAVVVPLICVPPLASQFLLPKMVALEIAAALGFGGFLLSRAGAGGARSDAAGGASKAPAMPPAIPIARAPANADADADVVADAIADADEAARDGTLGDGPLPLSRPLTWGAFAVLATVALSALAATRTPVGAPYAISAWARWAALFGLAAGVAAGVRDAPARFALLIAVTWSASVVSFIGLWQHVDLSRLPIPVISTPGSMFGNRNLGGEAIALSIPFGLAAFTCARLPRERALLALALGLEFVYLAATRARGAWLGGAAGALTWLILNRKSLPKTIVLGVAALGALALLVAVLPGRINPRDVADSKRFAGGIELLQKSVDPAATALRTRRGLWRRTVEMFRASPLVGVGAGNWPVIFPRYAEPGAAAEGVLRPMLAPRQAHNDLLQSLAETGIVGLGGLLCLAAGVIVALRRRLGAVDSPSRAIASAAAGALVALVAVGVTGFPLEMPASLMLSAVAIGLIATADRRSVARRATRIPIALALAATFAVVVVAVVAGEQRLRASWWLATSDHAVERDPSAVGAARALAALEHAEAATPGAFRIALATANTAMGLHRSDLSARAAEEALRTEPFSPGAWAVLAVAHLDSDPRLARADAERSLALLGDHPLALYAKARACEATGDRAAADSAWSRLAALATSAAPEHETSAWAQQLLRARDEPAADRGPPRTR